MLKALAVGGQQASVLRGYLRVGRCAGAKGTPRPVAAAEKIVQGEAGRPGNRVVPIEKDQRSVRPAGDVRPPEVAMVEGGRQAVGSGEKGAKSVSHASQNGVIPACGTAAEEKFCGHGPFRKAFARHKCHQPVDLVCATALGRGLQQPGVVGRLNLQGGIGCENLGRGFRREAPAHFSPPWSS